MDNSHQLEQLLRAYAGIKHSQPIFHAKVVEHLESKKADQVSLLISSSNEKELFKAQGYCQAINEVLKYMKNPEDLIRNLEQST